MKIANIIDVSLSDWDGVPCSVIFTSGCNFKCPFCYNKDVVEGKLKNISTDELFERLATNRVITGVVITGGEPTIHDDLPNLCRAIRKSLGLRIKLDSNGSRPSMIKKLLDDYLLDFISMDIKTSLNTGSYSKAVGFNVDKELLDRILESVELICESNIDYEFRTTLVPTLHTEIDIRNIAQWLSPCNKYVIQNFRANDTLNPLFNTIKPFNQKDLDKFLSIAKKYIPNSSLR